MKSIKINKNKGNFYLNKDNNTKDKIGKVNIMYPKITIYNFINQPNIKSNNLINDRNNKYQNSKIKPIHSIQNLNNYNSIN